MNGNLTLTLSLGVDRYCAEAAAPHLVEDHALVLVPAALAVKLLENPHQ